MGRERGFGFLHLTLAGVYGMVVGGIVLAFIVRLCYDGIKRDCWKGGGAF